MPRIYLDNAATSWPKPESVYEAVDQYQRTIGVAAGRGGYRMAEDVDRAIGQTRLQLSQLIGNRESERIVFAFNCTDALNLAIHGLLREGDHVVTSAAEHNSILRPLHSLRDEGRITFSTLEVNEHGVVDPDTLRQAIGPNTKLIALAHASNVTGASQPIEAIGKIAREHECFFLVDAAQTMGHLPLETQEIDLLAAPGHKGLMGPLGTAFLFVGERVQSHLHPVRQGGTGTESENPVQPDELPSKYEAGNLNVPGVLGLSAGVKYVAEQQLIGSDHLRKLSGLLVEGLQHSRTQVYSQANDCGIVTFNVHGYDPREMATLLDSVAEIQVRAGLHCAPLMHGAMNTLDIGGAVRASCGHFSTEAEINTLIESVRMLAENPM